MTLREIAAQAFEAHLDECEQCANHPFDLCAEGGPLLILSAEFTNITPKKWQRFDPKTPSC